ncbi:zinc ABC transporter ATP-binding protein AztA [Streptomyces sp. t39]|uniref:zinc ABC transporter ATP-binding protein AztA n=1 Tax=Streptomyces sp. t39 TaxID=1828156 RepID=UPI0011CE758B|nr:zinc ABC transporter ATP-binding protein AztA [Streptomyces sp. t39]TXS41827.1 metal ABC transporter ATP-binding protein [Streptomyces sp. t39]
MTIMFNKPSPLFGASAAPAPRVRVSDLSAGYPGRPVLRRIDADIRPFTITAVVGPNGSGKSTLLGVLAGVIDPAAGDIAYGSPVPPAFVPQRAAVGDTLPLTVRQTVEMGRWAERGPWRRLTRQDRARVDTAMERLGITALAARQLGELSGGQRQRALIAQGLAQGSDLLLLDEPTTGLDPEAGERIAALLTGLAADGVTVVQATHDLAAARAADDCLLLHEGRLAAQGRPDQVLTASALTGIRYPV